MILYMRFQKLYQKKNLETMNKSLTGKDSEYIYTDQ